MEKKRIFILPGELVVIRQPTVIATLLGSCVAVCLYSKGGNGGGMNHYMLPSGTNDGMLAKYGDYATEKLLEQFAKIEPNPANLVAKIYGGGAVVGHLNTGFKVGDRNIEIARSILAKKGIRIAFEDVGGDLGRKIFFDNTTGDVEVRMIQKSDQRAQLEEKKKDLANRKIRTLIVDDSSTVRSVLRRALADDPEIHVIGEAADAFEARTKILELDPDVITLDIIMPKMDGVSFLKKLMVHYPKPIIIVSSVAQKGSKMRLRAEDIGAVDVVDKEELKLYQSMETVRQVLSTKIKMAATRIVRKKDAADVKDI
ncbi:MAG: response regulator [Nitrospinae bacterium]|nr:response regulator [Nitrospinota bacterium]